jgi:AsmA family
MTQQQPDESEPIDSAAGEKPPEKPKKKKRRLLLKTAVALIVVIVILVILAPMILSTSVAKQLIVQQVNRSALNGTLKIKDWSIGWTSGIHLDGVELTGADNEHLVSAAEIDVPVSLLRAATGNIDLGNTTISGIDINAIIDRNGNLNILEAIKPSKKPPSNQPTRLPNIKGVIHLKQITGTLQDDPDRMTVGLDPKTPLAATITIKGTNRPIEDAVDLALQLQERNFVKVKMSGTVSAVRDNLVAVDQLAANQTIELSDGDLTGVAQLLKALGVKMDVTGVLSGKIAATVNTLNNISADAGLNVADLSAGGEPLAGDSVAFQSVALGLKASVTSSAGKKMTVKLDLPITAQPNGPGGPDQISVNADVPVDSVSQAAEVFKILAARLMGGKTAAATAIAGTGQVKISTDLNVANLVSQLPHLVHLEPGTTLASGRLTHETTLTLSGGQAVVETQTHLKNFSGTSNGQPVELDDIDTTAGMTAVGGDQPQLRDISLSLTSALANVHGGGATLGKINFQGESDLKAVQRQLSQIIDLDSLLHAPAGSHVSLAGTLGFHAHTDGDLTAADSEVAAGADFSATGVDVNIPGRRQMHEPKLTATISGKLHHTASQFVRSVNDLAVTVQSPAVDFQAAADVNVGGKFGVSVPSFAISRGKLDLPLLQQEFGGLLSLLAARGQGTGLLQKIADNSVRITTGSVAISGKGQFNPAGFGFQQPLEITLEPTDLKMADESAAGGSQTLHLPPMSLVVSGTGSVSEQDVATVKNLTLASTIGTSDSPLIALELSADASAALGGGAISAPRIELRKCDADLAGLQATFGLLLPLVMPASPPPLAKALADNAIVCTSGKLSASMTGSYDGTTFTMSRPLTVAIADLSVRQPGATPSEIVSNQTVRLTAGGSVAGDLSVVNDLSVAIDSSLAKKISLTNGRIALRAGPLEMLRSVDVEVDDLDAAKVDGLVNLLFARAVASVPSEKVIVVVPPPQVTSGLATLKARISRSGDKTTADVSDAVVHDLALTIGGKRCAWPGDITAKLSAELDTRGAQVEQLLVTSLSADTGVGTTIGLTDQKPIVFRNLSDPEYMAAEGGISIDGEIAPAARLAEAFGGLRPNSLPYQGHLHLDESLTKEASQPTLHLAGGGAITHFAVLGQPPANGGAAPVVFAEDKISLSNPLDFDFPTFSVIIDRSHPVAVSLESTGALGLRVSGTVNDVVLTRRIAADNPLQIQISYDLAKLWSIVKPLIPPSQRQTVADLQISGQQQRTFTITGSYPIDKPFGDALAMLNVGGYFTVDHVSTHGITIQNLDVPLSLKGGVLRTVYADQPEGRNVPKPATCNGGTLDIGVLSVDVRSDPMLLTMEGADASQPHEILRDVSLNPTMAKTFMGKILNNPAFVNANDSRGLVTVSVQRLRQIPLSGLVLQSSPQNQGFAEVRYSVREMYLGSALLAVFGNSSVSAEINDADVKLQNGRVTEDTTIMIDGNKPLRLAGVVILSTEQFAPMTAYIPSALFARLVPPEARGYVPDQVIVPLKGDMNHPQLQLDQAIAETIKKGAKKAVINGLLQGLQQIGRH